MEGDPSIPVIVDTTDEGLHYDFDVQAAYEAMYKSATTPGKDNLMRPDIDDYIAKGYVPLTEQYDNSVSHALEYYIADYALSRFCSGFRKKRKKMQNCSMTVHWVINIITVRVWYIASYFTRWNILLSVRPDGAIQFLD